MLCQKPWYCGLFKFSFFLHWFNSIFFFLITALVLIRLLVELCSFTLKMSCVDSRVSFPGRHIQMLCVSRVSISVSQPGNETQQLWNCTFKGSLWCAALVVDCCLSLYLETRVRFLPVCTGSRLWRYLWTPCQIIVIGQQYVLFLPRIKQMYWCLTSFCNWLLFYIVERLFCLQLTALLFLSKSNCGSGKTFHHFVNKTEHLFKIPPWPPLMIYIHISWLFQ